MLGDLRNELFHEGIFVAIDRNRMVLKGLLHENSHLYKREGHSLESRQW